MERSNRLANWLEANGVGKGDTVMLMLGNQVELWDAMLAVMKIGGVILPTAQALQDYDLEDRDPALAELWRERYDLPVVVTLNIVRFPVPVALIIPLSR